METLQFFPKKMSDQLSIAAWPVMFRYSEVLFNKAEALMRKNRCAKWQSYKASAPSRAGVFFHHTQALIPNAPAMAVATAIITLRTVPQIDFFIHYTF